MNNRWGIHAPNAGFRRMGEFFDAGFQNYTVLHVNQDLIPQIRERYPNARILVRMYLQNWYRTDPASWARDIADIANRLRPFSNELTWANEQNLDLEGHPLGASPANPIPPPSLYDDINRWNLEMIRRLREALPWARLHYPAFANDHSDEQNQGGYVGLEICRPSITAADVMDCHVYWNVEQGPLTLDGGQRFVLTHNFFPDKPIFISECGNFAVEDPRTPEQYVTFIRSLYHYPYVEGATFFIWDSDDAPENARNVIQRSGGLVRALVEASKDAPRELPPVPAAPPPLVRPAPAPSLPATPGGNEYVVLPGDTLLGIARRFGVDLVALMNANSISDARTLRAGQTLRIPGAPVVTTPPARGDGAGEAPPPPVPAPAEPLPSSGEGAVYVVRSGDTVSAIARRFNVTVQAIVVANNLPNANLIRVGQRLVIPKPSMVLSRAVERAATASVGVLGIGDPNTPQVSASEIEAFLKGKRTTFYVARKGDTIPRIARLFQMDPLILAQINQVGMAGELIPGTRIIIPMS